MFRILGGSSPRYCDGISRRSFVQIGVAGMASVSLADVLRAKEASKPARAAKDTAVILVWLDGGPSHMDLYDMKPDAPDEYRGFWNPIHTNVPGMEISELCPLQAKVADKFSLIRSLHHEQGDHFAGAHVMLTGRLGASGGDQVGKYPSIGSIAAHECGARRSGVPAYVAAPQAASVGQKPGYFGANYLGVAYNPFDVGANPADKKFRVRNLERAGTLTLDRLEDRRELLKALDTQRRDMDDSGAMQSMDRFEADAFDLVTGPAAQGAFDISKEDARLRDRYGRNQFGQSMLLARRLVEAGTTFVTVHSGGWDSHTNLRSTFEKRVPEVDCGLAALFEDLANRGLSDQVCVVMCGEFGRTPKINKRVGKRKDDSPGRDHWGNAMFCLIGGGGVRGGQIIGSTNRLGERPKDRPLVPTDVHATLYHVLGVDPTQQFLSRSGRPISILDTGEPIAELL